MTGQLLPFPQAIGTQDGHGRVSPQARPWSVYFCSDNTYLQEQIAILSRELTEARYEIATRDREAAFVRAPSPSTVHDFGFADFAGFI
jgi:hypothetical protein